ncbi:hypothetical protein RUND412_004904 [Rhizina undulata]
MDDAVGVKIYDRVSQLRGDDACYYIRKPICFEFVAEVKNGGTMGFRNKASVGSIWTFHLEGVKKWEEVLTIDYQGAQTERSKVITSRVAKFACLVRATRLNSYRDPTCVARYRMCETPQDVGNGNGVVAAFGVEFQVFYPVYPAIDPAVGGDHGVSKGVERI